MSETRGNEMRQFSQDYLQRMHEVWECIKEKIEPGAVACFMQNNVLELFAHIAGLEALVEEKDRLIAVLEKAVRAAEDFPSPESQSYMEIHSLCRKALAALGKEGQ